MTGITGKKFIRYAILPGIKPRLQELFLSGFHFVPYLIALVYQSVRLLPDNHPYLNTANLGRFGIRHVIGEAANNLVLSGKNIDQIVLFGTILIGLVLMLVQIALLFLTLFLQPALAAMPTSFAGFFVTPAANAPQDLAYIFLDLVFGVPGMFGSCVDPGAAAQCLDAGGRVIVSPLTNAWILQGLGWPFPIHDALHQMFQIYSLGLLVVAVFITLYFVVAIVAETAQTGTAFGKRFNKVWAPIRLVVAFGLLIPVTNGLNASQYIVLYAAKFGSGFATNGWNLFNNSLSGGSFIDTAENLVSRPNVPEIGGLLQFLYVARTCAELENLKNNRELSDTQNPKGPTMLLAPYAVKDPAAVPNALLLPYALLDYEDLIAFADGASKVTIRFGVRDKDVYPSEKGNVSPVCGELTLPLNDPRDPGNAANPPDPAPEILQRYYLYAIQELWYTVLPGDNIPGGYSISAFNGVNFPRNTALAYGPWRSSIGPILPPILPKQEYKTVLQEFYKQDLEAVMLDPASQGLDAVVFSADGALTAQADSPEWAVDPILIEKGWAGAGIWYNKVAELNGSVSTAVLGVPMRSRYPTVMESVIEKKKKEDQSIPPTEAANPKTGQGSINTGRPENAPMAMVLWKAFSFWQDGSTTTHTAETGNILIDGINALLGTEGLYSMRDNPNVHPLAQLVGIGKSLVESSIRNTILAGGFDIAGIALKPAVGGLSKMAIGLLMTFATISLTAGFILFYIIPFLPFIYFFFAVGGWVKGIFQAMLGAPLWALAHIRIDGNGLPGQAAVGGYYLIFEIFLRPILIVFGLLASITIFSALVSAMNDTWQIVMANLTGFDANAEASGVGASLLEYMRSPVDEFFYTVVYVIVVYMMGMSSFKLIDQIPNNILRWMGQSVASFNDTQMNPAEGLIGSAGIGSQQALSKLGGEMEKTMVTMVDRAPG